MTATFALRAAADDVNPIVDSDVEDRVPRRGHIGSSTPPGVGDGVVDIHFVENKKKLTFKFQGRRYRFTDVHGKVVTPILA